MRGKRRKALEKSFEKLMGREAFRGVITPKGEQGSEHRRLKKIASRNKWLTLDRVVRG